MRRVNIPRLAQGAVRATCEFSTPDKNRRPRAGSSIFALPAPGRAFSYRNQLRRPPRSRFRRRVFPELIFSRLPGVGWTKKPLF